MVDNVDEYLDFSIKINEQISAQMLGLSMSVSNYDSKSIINSLLKDQATIRGFRFEGKSRNRISGLITKDEYETSIIYNSAMSEKRINFTIAHEVTHYLYHLDDDNHYHYDTKQSLQYMDTDRLPEFQANIGASALLLPDSALVYELKIQTHPAHISEKYGLSESALYRRLVQVMQGHFEASFLAASRTGTTIMNQYSHKGKVVMRELGYNLEQKLLFSDPFYEAICQ